MTIPSDVPRLSKPKVSALSKEALPVPNCGIGHVLVCLDRSPFSEVCVPHAVGISRTFGSRLTLLHVLEAQHERSGHPPATDAIAWDISRREASEYLERIKRHVVEECGQRVDVRLEQGHPAERIPWLARELDADLTVLGSHGEGGAADWNLGSTVQHVLAVARGSVLVARSSSPAPAVVRPRRVLVPLDGSLRTESVLPTASRISKSQGAELVLVHVVEEPQPNGVLFAPEDMALARELAARLESRAKGYLRHVGDQLIEEGVLVRTIVICSADAHQALLDLVKKEAVDLVILSAHGATCNMERRFGIMTTDLLTNLLTSTLVLQDVPESELHRARDRVDGGQSPPPRANVDPLGS
jgi:nucleotide-binding universal stress UspA family protein